MQKDFEVKLKAFKIWNRVYRRKQLNAKSKTQFIANNIIAKDFYKRTLKSKVIVALSKIKIVNLEQNRLQEIEHFKTFHLENIYFHKWKQFTEKQLIQKINILSRVEQVPSIWEITYIWMNQLNSKESIDHFFLSQNKFKSQKSIGFFKKALKILNKKLLVKVFQSIRNYFENMHYFHQQMYTKIWKYLIIKIQKKVRFRCLAYGMSEVHKSQENNKEFFIDILNSLDSLNNDTFNSKLNSRSSKSNNYSSILSTIDKCFKLKRHNDYLKL